MGGFTVSFFDLPTPAWVYDRQTLHFLAVNDAAVAKYGYARDEFLAMSLLDIRPQADREAVVRLVGGPMPGSLVDGPWRHRTKSGEAVLVETISIETEYEGRAARAVMCIDITQRLRAEQALRESEQRLADSQEVAHLGTWRRDFVKGNAVWSRELCRIFGVDPQHAGDPEVWRKPLTHPDDVELVDRTLDEAIAGDGKYQLDHRVVRTDGAVRWVHVQGRYEFDDLHEPVALIGTLLDITGRKEAERELDFIAHHDVLTGLENRAAAERRLDRQLADSATTRVAVAFIDFDGFKAINDTLGHAVGDALLREAAQRLTRAVGSKATVARWGGDEFVVIAPEINSILAVESLAYRLLRTLEDPYDSAGRSLHARPSIGVSLHPDHGASGADLIRNADTAMYVAKQRKSAFEVFDHAMHDAARERLELENGLRAALKEGAFTLLFQPIVDATTNAVLSAEALVRWRHPTRGIVAPAFFMDVAEETGLIVAIDEFVLGEACRIAQSWCRSGMAIPIAVNVSARDFQRPNIVATIDRAIRSSGLPASMVELELTESGVMRDVEHAVRIMRQLRDLGVRLAMDDFGTGYSSLAHLKRFPLDTIKIDRSFVADLPGSEFDREITASIVRLGRSAGLHVVAEGVETAEQLAVVRALGCSVVQGYYLARPMPAHEFAAFVGRSRAAASPANHDLPSVL
ncbi:MAG TPA: EAL domain-containing protein [Candidatus Baltobacteraceae bacterium]